MRRAVWCGALALLATVSTAEAQVVDCWLLDGTALQRARAQGHCRDAFARNSAPRPVPEPAAPPTWSSPREQAPQRSTDAEAMQGAVNALRAPPPRPADPVTAFLRGVGREVDSFLGDVQHDFESLGRLLGGQSGSPPSEMAARDR